MIKSIFAEPIYQVEDVLTEEENQKIIDECYRLKPQTEDGSRFWDCHIFTSFGGDPVNQNRTFHPLFRKIEDHIKIYMESINMFLEVDCQNSWFNIAGVDEFQEQHTHPTGRVSAIFYTKSPWGSSGTKFKPTYENQMGEFYERGTEFSRTYTTKPIERSLVLFPSHVPHLVPPGLNAEDRITISGNWA